MNHYLYKITNQINGKSYIGITNNPKRRKYEHFQKKSGNFSIVRLAVQKYGPENFSFKVLVVGDRNYISELEVKAISLFNCREDGYNILTGGSPEKGSTVAFRVDDSPVLAGGFWFPNARTAIKSLNINHKTFYRRKSLGTLHLEFRPVNTKLRPQRGSLEDLKNRSESMRNYKIRLQQMVAP